MVTNSPSLNIVNRPIEELIPYINNARTHSKEQVALIAASIKEFGFNDPIAIDKNNGIIAGHGRLEAARMLGLTEVPTIELGHLTKEQQKAYILAHNRIALDAGWNFEILNIEMQEIKNAGFDIDATGFNKDEIDRILQIENIEFNPATIDEQGKLDEAKQIKCPNCNHEFTP